MISGNVGGGHVSGRLSAATVGGKLSEFSINGVIAVASIRGQMSAASLSGALSTASVSGKVVAGGDAVMPQGVVIPSGMAYYNGYLLPQIPEISGRQYAWIRSNDQNDTYDLVLGTGIWYTKSGTATLDNWQLMFNNYATELSYQYSIPRDGTATDWGEYVTSANYYGTNNRKVIWSSHDIKIASAGGNVLYRHGVALLPTE